MMELPQSYSTVSFDVFDTVLIRPFLDPKDVFRNVERSLLKEGIQAAAFADSRIAAELEARRLHNFKREVTLDAIYRRLTATYDFSASALDRAKRLELEREAQILGPISGMLRAIRQLRARGTRIAFVSDIYLDEAFVRRLLLRHGLFKTGDTLLVSSSSGEMKATGSLFQTLLNITGESPADLCHVGDNFESDVRQAEGRGLRAVHVTATQPNRYEQDEGSDRLVQLALGAARYTRLARPRDDGRHPTIWKTTANVSAPLIFSFVTWSLQQALRRRLKRIYFFARDGEIMLEIARRIVERFYARQIEVRYLHVSRQALLFPAMTEVSERDLSWIFAPTSLLTPEIVLRRINFSPEELSEPLKRFGIDDLAEHLRGERLAAMKNLVLSSQREVLERARSFRNTALGYFRQEGLFEFDEVAVVDIGWSGTLQYALGKMLRTQSADLALHGLYFGILRRSLHSPKDSMSAWFTDCDSPNPLTKDVYIIPMTELFTAATHGGVDRYSVEGNRYHYVLRKKKNEAALAWGVEVQQASMRHFTETLLNLLDEDDLVDFSERLLPIATRNYRQFMLEPSQAEAKAYCAYQDAEDQTEAYYRPMGWPYSFRELQQYFSSGFSHHHNEWRQGSLQLSDPRLAQFARCISA